ncbi:MAG TPA: hypothetical protein VFP87_00050 [Chitinophagaceae bacterium]|nr:hypothetical protein [Chitinophagaceae bacterium]
MALEEKGNPEKIAFLITVDFLTSNFLIMPTNVSERKRLEYTATQVLEIPDKVTILREHEELDSIVADPGDEKDTAAVATCEQKPPHFYQLKIRMRKYDFL